MVSVLAGKPSQTGDGKEWEMCYARCANAAWHSEDKESRKSYTRKYRVLVSRFAGFGIIKE